MSKTTFEDESSKVIDKNDQKNKDESQDQEFKHIEIADLWNMQKEQDNLNSSHNTNNEEESNSENTKKEKTLEKLRGKAREMWSRIENMNGGDEKSIILIEQMDQLMNDTHKTNEIKT